MNCEKNTIFPEHLVLVTFLLYEGASLTIDQTNEKGIFVLEVSSKSRYSYFVGIINIGEGGLVVGEPLLKSGG